MAKRRRPTAARAKIHRAYTVSEAARARGVCKATVRRWLKSGLPAITDHRPYLILGADLVEFLRERVPSKQPCQLDECYCFRCHTPRTAAFGTFRYVPFTSAGGNLQAKCAVCFTAMFKRISHTKLAALGQLQGVTIEQAHQPIGESSEPCGNAHLGGARESHA